MYGFEIKQLRKDRQGADLLTLRFREDGQGRKARETKARAGEAQERIMLGKLDRAELVSELSVLFNYVGVLAILARIPRQRTSSPRNKAS